jgi:hypothetical protein
MANLWLNENRPGATILASGLSTDDDRLMNPLPHHPGPHPRKARHACPRTIPSWDPLSTRVPTHWIVGDSASIDQ